VFPPAALRAILRLVAAASASVIAASAVRWLLEPRLPWSGFAGTALLFAAVLTAGGIVYLGIARRPPSPESLIGPDGNA
jgi:ABC-type transport system involved in cytochrome c biogenesis permease subunit